MSIIAALYPLAITRGSDLVEEFEFLQSDDTPWDFTGYKIRCQIREQRDRASTIILELTATITDAVNGLVSLTATDAETLAIEQRHGWYDLIMQDADGIDAYYLYGPVIISGSATENPL